jgi:deazaflavin-dependent oxidoreductase (nitroreductase family)
MRLPRFLWRILQVGPRLAYALGLGPIAGSFVLLLTTRGRKTGLPRTTPLVYERLGDEYHVASARGPMADWYRNIQSDPRVEVRVGRRRFRGLGEAVTDAVRIADFLERQMARSPRLFGAILRAEGIPPGERRENLIRLAERRPMVVIRPSSEA